MMVPMTATPTRTGSTSACGTTAAACAAATSSGLGYTSDGSGSISVPTLVPGEPVVQQVRGLLPRRNRLAGAAQQNGDQSATIAVGSDDEGLVRFPTRLLQQRC